jgi:hypothetical protein
LTLLRQHHLQYMTTMTLIIYNFSFSQNSEEHVRHLLRPSGSPVGRQPRELGHRPQREVEDPGVNL